MLEECALACYVSSMNNLTDHSEILHTTTEIYANLSGFNELSKPLVEHVQPFLKDLMHKEELVQLLCNIPAIWNDLLIASAQPKK